MCTALYLQLPHVSSWKPWCDKGHDAKEGGGQQVHAVHQEGHECMEMEVHPAILVHFGIEALAQAWGPLKTSSNALKLAF